MRTANIPGTAASTSWQISPDFKITLTVSDSDYSALVVLQRLPINIKIICVFRAQALDHIFGHCHPTQVHGSVNNRTVNRITP